MEHVMEHKNKNQNLRYENALKITYQKESQLSPILSLDTLGKNGIHQIGCVSCKKRLTLPQYQLQRPQMMTILKPQHSISVD